MLHHETPLHWYTVTTLVRPVLLETQPYRADYTVKAHTPSHAVFMVRNDAFLDDLLTIGRPTVKRLD